MAMAAVSHHHPQAGHLLLLVSGGGGGFRNNNISYSSTTSTTRRTPSLNFRSKPKWFSSPIRCQSTSTDEPKTRNLLDNASNLLTNFLSGANLGSMPVAEGAVSDLFGRPLFLALYDWFLEHGSVYKLAFGPKAFVVVSDPIVVRHILRENAFSYDKGVLADILEPIMGKGLIPADLSTWKQRRRVIAPGFHALYLESMVKIFTNCSGRTILKFEELLEREGLNGGKEIELDLEEEFSSLALDIIGLSVFNYDFGSVTKESPIIKISKMLKPDKWQATFDSDGKVFGFQKALKSIILGGVDPSIRPEVWEFLLGCYTLSSTAEHRRQLRTARRERYGDLINQCQMMHSSIGTGSLAYAVGSKVMDMRTMSKDGGRSEPQVKSRHASDNAKRLENYCDWDNNCTDTPYACEGESSSDSADLVSVRGSTDSAAYDSSCFIPTSGPYNCHSPKLGSEAHGSQYVTESYFDFPPLPVTDLFEKNGKDGKGREFHDNRLSTRRKLQFEDDHMHSFQINNNVDLIMESNGSSYNDVSRPINCEIEMVHSDAHDPASSWSSNLEHKTEIINELRISDVPDTPSINATTSQGGPVSEDRVSEWLWTLHRIVLDVVRTDSHLEFYEDSKNLARMSDILAVYAWVDPATGYCQGMSDLLSPFVVLFEDNADAFWCFEMLLRRMRESFQMEGPTGVMKQLQSLWRILELTDKEMFAHLSHIGAESLHFAFRMLLVLFRRELTFNEALCMWEMMWAADFDESVSCNLEENCLEPLVIEIPRESGAEMGEESVENVKGTIKGVLQSNHGNGDPSISDSSGIKSASTHSFCGLTRNFWSKNDRLHMCTVVSSRRNGDDELPVFCVAAILFTNRQKIIRETNSIDDLIKIFNDRMLKIRVKRCVSTAIKLRKKYFYKLIKSRSPASQHND